MNDLKSIVCFINQSNCFGVFDREHKTFSYVKIRSWGSPVRVDYEPIDYRWLFTQYEYSTYAKDYIWEYLEYTDKAEYTVDSDGVVFKNLPLASLCINADFERTDVFLSLMYDDIDVIIQKYGKGPTERE